MRASGVFVLLAGMLGLAMATGSSANCNAWPFHMSQCAKPTDYGVQVSPWW